MKKLLLLFILAAASYTSGQSFDWNIRGGLNIMDSKTSGKDVAVLYHAGAEAGIRLANFGFYGELLYSLHENQYGGDPVAYFVPAIVLKGYPRKIIFAEMGAAMAKMADNSGVSNDILNPDRMVYFLPDLDFTYQKLNFHSGLILNNHMRLCR